VRSLAAVVVLLSALATPAAARVSAPQAPAKATFIGPYTGVGSGHLHRVRNVDNQDPDPADRLVVRSTDDYRLRFRYSFRIDGFGFISGTGNGSYQAATWHLEGTNGSHGPFSCDVPMRTTQFRVRITGTAADGKMTVRFELDGAREANDEMYCGANFSGFASDDARMARSLELVQPPGGIVIDQAQPSIAPMVKTVPEGDATDFLTSDHTWSFTIQAPAGPPTEPPDRTPGTVPDPRRAGRGGRICTIDGTARSDRLRGTAGNDVICGFGGGDTIDGRGGHDLIYGGLGNDRITGGPGLDVLYGNAGRDRLSARDGKRDRLDGGSGRDNARVDRGRDRVRGVERVG
jgi:Ca2+-binding RTX toxin-like protein